MTLNKAILALAFCLLAGGAMAQVTLSIDSVVVANHIIVQEPDVWDEDLQDGPYLYFYFSLVNESAEAVTLYPDEARYIITFNIDGRPYRHELTPLPYEDQGTVVLAPEKAMAMEASDHLLLGTGSLKKSNNANYTLELLKAMPTLKLKYLEPKGVRAVASHIGQVIMHQ